MGVAIPPIIQAIDAEQVHTYHAGTYGKRWVQGGIAASAVVAEERRAAGGGVEFGPAGDVRFVTELARRVPAKARAKRLAAGTPMGIEARPEG